MLRRLDELRARIEQRRPDWYEPIATAMLAFRMEGVLPKDELLRGLVLADAELDAHRANKKGRDVSEVMALFNRIARSEGDERDDTLRQVSELAAGRKLIPTLKDAPPWRPTLA